jgi:hypothetical protein
LNLSDELFVPCLFTLDVVVSTSELFLERGNHCLALLFFGCRLLRRRASAALSKEERQTAEENHTVTREVHSGLLLFRGSVNRVQPVITLEKAV